jgi:hypothetical protein
MKRLAASLLFVAVVVPAVSFAQGYPLRPTTKLVPCGQRCKAQQCGSMCWQRAANLCNRASAETHDGCVKHVDHTCLVNCMH